MDTPAFRQTCEKWLKDHQIKEVFEHLAKHLAPQSDCVAIAKLLEDRYSRLRNKVSQQLLSPDQLAAQTDQLVKDIFELIHMLEASDLQEADIKGSLASLFASIEWQHSQLQKRMDERSSSVVSIGENLEKLGILLSRKAAPDDNMPYAVKLKAGANKAHRRVKIGCMEIRELKLALINSLEKILEAYVQLVGYLDLPDEAIGAQQLEKIKGCIGQLNKLIQKLEQSNASQSTEFVQSIEQMKGIFQFRDQLGPEYQVVFDAFEDIIQRIQKLVPFLDNCRERENALLNQFKNVWAELQLNIDEHQV